MTDIPRPKVSVCIATYNQAAYIRDCVTGVLAQAADVEVELLVGDDCSTDGTSEILASLAAQFPGRVVLVARSENLGVTANYQDLVRRATGDFVAHLDGDDAWLPGKLLAQTRFMAAHPECVAVYTNGVVLDEQGRTLGKFTNAQPPVMDVGYLAAKGNFLMHSSMMYRASHKHLFLQLGPPPVIDYLIHLTLAQTGPLGFIDQVLAVYRQGTTSSMTRHAFPLVQRLLWQAIIGSFAALPPQARSAAGAHFAAAVLIARFRGHADASWSAYVDEAAVELGCSRCALLLRSVPHVMAILLHGVRQRLLVLAGCSARRALFARV